MDGEVEMNSFVANIGLTEFEGDVRARDLDIAERLGFGRPRDIRKIIDRHAGELEAFGTCATVARVIKGRRGSTTSTEYWLNEEQALLVSILSEAPNAPAVRAMLIKVFVAWRRGALPPTAAFPADIAEKIDRMFGIERMLSHKVTEIEKALPAMISRSVEDAILSDPRRAALDLLSVREILDDAKAIQKGRDALNRKMGRALRDLAAQSKECVASKSAHTGVWLFQRAFVRKFMKDFGDLFVRDHNAKVTGQGVLHLVRPAKEPAKDSKKD